jgi:hypothetical protein
LSCDVLPPIFLICRILQAFNYDLLSEIFGPTTQPRPVQEQMHTFAIPIMWFIFYLQRKNRHETHIQKIKLMGKSCC